MTRTFITAMLFAAAALSACRKAPKTDEQAQAAGGVVSLPSRTADAEPKQGGTTFDVDERTGRAKAVLVLRLDYFPDPKPGVTNLPVCYAAFPESFDVGVATCDGKPDVSVPVLAKNVDQDCYTDPSVDRIPALQPLVIPGCKRGSVTVHSFEPRLKVDVEIRDVN